ncbi:MAG TPA: Rv2231c family pyridoxal phosphate-dependent protein CobC [Actinomycetota bacterium]|nr:Rv2231c family pyridoxal phosphate-dependent protein CobC [Actinomycetota bacterium]
MLTLVIGGVRSGKSQVAERIAAATPPGIPVIYLATYVSPPEGDPEMAERVARHRERRPSGWRTVEAPDPLAVFGADLAGAGAATLVIENLTGWVSSLLAAGRPVLPAVAAFAAASAARDGATIVVADETGLGGVAAHPAARRFTDVAGEASQLLASAACSVLLVVAGQALPLKRPAAPDLAWPGAGADLAALRHHGDAEARPGDLDFALSVLPGGPPPRIAKMLDAAMGQLGRYPNDGPATRALAELHGRRPEEVLPVNGSAEAFWLLAGLPVAGAVCVHPSFTEPELALRTRGVAVTQAFRDPASFALRPETVDPVADLVVTGNPNNPSGTLDPAEVLAGLAAPGRLLVVDEAFMDLVPGQAESLAGRGDLPGVVVVRSLTKVLGLPGLRAGYLIGPPEVVAAFRAARQPWSVSTPALAVLEAYAASRAELDAVAAAVATERARLAGALAVLPGVSVWPSAANFLLLRVPDGPRVRDALLQRRIAVRRCDTFPGLTADHVRVAVRTPEEDDRLVVALKAVLGGNGAP